MDHVQPIKKSLHSACSMFLQDLEALPDDSFQKKFGPKVRTVADIVYEVNLVNDHIRMTIGDEEPFEWPTGGWITAPESFQSKEAVLAGFKESSGKLLQTVDAFTTEEMESPLHTDDGETTRSERCRFMSLHLWYHSGQLNFIQTLLGDNGWHWK